ncbi:hypothetical protein BYT27DRAFT_7262831 [Phlegmacium glaucopus]|nr:hypothetical protein BYT27DRAFT_7262831 [Phlegmacium glaucopus]
MIISSDEDEGANIGHQRMRTFGDLDKGEDDLLDHVRHMQGEMDLVNSRLHTTEVMLDKCQDQVEDYRHFTQELLERMHGKDDEVAELMDRLRRAEEVLEMMSGYEEEVDEGEPMAGILEENAPALPANHIEPAPVTSVEPAVTQARAIQPVPVTELAPALATEPVPTDRPAPPSPMLTPAEATDPAPAPVIERATEVQPAPPTPILLK